MLVKPIEFLRASLRSLWEFPDDANRDAGYQLDRVQPGMPPDDFKPMPTIGKGVEEIRVLDDTATQRAEKMEQLANQVDAAADLKAISDLQARIAIESAQLNNELIKLQALNQVAQQERETRQQQMHQRAFQTSFKYKSAN